MFFGAKIKPGQATVPKADNGSDILHISQISLNDPTDNNKTYVQLQNHDETYTVCILEKGKNESATVDLFINVSKKVKLSTKGGKNEVHIVGYFEPTPDEDEDEDDLNDTLLKSVSQTKNMNKPLINGNKKNKLEDGDNQETKSDKESKSKSFMKENNDNEDIDEDLDELDENEEDEDEDDDEDDEVEEDEQAEKFMDENIDQSDEESEEEPLPELKIDKKRKQFTKKPKNKLDNKKAKIELNSSQNNKSLTKETMQSYKNSLVEFLKKNGKTHIGSLGQKVKKPEALQDKLGKFIKEHQDTFKLENGFVTLVK